jgi:hypothetical protein
MANQGNRGFGSSEQRGQDAGRTSPSGTNFGSLPEESTAGGVVGAIKDKAQELASNVASTAEHAWEGTRQGVQRAASTVADTAENAWESMTTCMRNYPFATFFVGVGLGFLLAGFLRRDNS